ncbi:GMC family oxidoreductase [Sphingomonas sp. BIUV-7]|uniref:GMC family oxidoreductase n=1 Tax=Sphingomonas natans TaxID=3063330 RepID=A0ABT8Y795_9SPHN|nr:GMC family oxidoreductase [Sphingomonas sp. BIUV-7]MDO6414183.1 GMC family oxidoreductase [Sphingomonas sp. BIUV-7]
MIIDLEKASENITLHTEICIVGSGAAGQTIARRLLTLGHEVTLLESGGTDYELGTAGLNDGKIVGQAYYPLRDARLRFFGGTTAIWGGRCAELEPIDLEKREWIPHSGWPLGWREIRDYYEEARPLFGQPNWRPDISDMVGAGLTMPPFDEALLTTPLWTFDTSLNRFTIGRADDIASHPRARIVLHANVTRLQANLEASSVRRLIARTIGGRRLVVHARAIVLAAGGIETPRLLLASRTEMPGGLGNGHDLVGRFFMEHPHARGGRIVGGAAWRMLKLFARRHRIEGQDMAAMIATSPALQRKQGLLNSSLTIVARQPEDARKSLGMRIYDGMKHDIPPNRAGRALWMGAKNFASSVQRHVDPARPWALYKMGRLELSLLVRAEQAPNRDSRITMTRDVDVVGMPRVQLDWRLTELDKRSVIGLVDALGSELRRLGLGHVERAEWLDDPRRIWHSDPLVSSHPLGGYHHIGTTRMSSDPRTGVVDPHGRVHGIANLYIVGSSTFPTSGWANPTVTIAALALRTGDRISASLKHREQHHPRLQAASTRSSAGDNLGQRPIAPRMMAGGAS